MSSHISLAVIAATVLCVAVGCGGDNEQENSSTKPDRPKLPCEKQDFPCTFADVDTDVNQRTLNLMKKALQRADGGAKWKSTLEWLRNRTKMAEANGSSNAIRFRLEGGRPAWVYLQRSEDPFAQTSSALTETNSSESKTRKMPIIAGGDEEPREPKEALVLTADPTIASQLTTHIRDQLTGVRGYTPGSVTYRTKANELSLSDFQNWGAYDFIYFLAHGGCVDECREASISTGIELGTLDEYPEERFEKHGENDWDPVYLNKELAEQKAAYEESASEVRAEALQDSPYADVPGADVVIRDDCHMRAGEDLGGKPTRVSWCENPYELGLNAPFFRAYSDDLDEALLIGNSCKLFSNRASDLARHFGSGDNVFLGWSDSVLGPRSSEVIDPLFDLLDDGIPAWTALRRVEKDNGVIDDNCAENDSCPAELRHSDGEDTIRLREIVSVADPYGNSLKDGANITPVVQGTPGDGEPDALNLTAVVAGIDEEASTASSEPGGYDVRFEWNGNEVGESYNVGDEGQPIGQSYAYAADDLQVQLDSDIDPDEKHSLTAIAELPEGGESKTKVEGLSINPCWAKFEVGGFNWDSQKMQLTERFGTFTVWQTGGQGRAYLEIGPPDEPAKPRLKVQVNGSVDEPGKYAAVFGVIDWDGENGWESPENASGDLVRGEFIVDAVHELPRSNRIIQGSFQGPVTDPDTSTTHTLTGSFSLPARYEGIMGTSGGLWPDACSGEADAN